MQFNNGDTVEVYGKQYTVVGTVKRSYAVKNDKGKVYKVTAKNMRLVKRAENPTEPEVSIPCSTGSSALERILRHKRIFEPNAQLPTDEASCKSWFDHLECEASPENLHCDGEISHSQAMRKLAEIKRAWKELEKIQGKKQDASALL